MRRVIRMMLLLMVVTLAACSAGGAAEPTVDSENDETTNESALVFVTPEREGGYPAPNSADAYPVAPAEAELPTGYPEDTMPVPAEEVDLPDVPTAAPDSGPQVLPAPGHPDTSLSPGMARLLAAAIDDLSAQSDIPAEDIRLVSAEPMTWSNGALGCPAEGMAYAEVIIEGMVFTLEAGGETYTYHTDSGQNYVLCRDGAPVSSGSVR